MSLFPMVSLPPYLHPNDATMLFLDFDVIILDDVNPWAIVTSLNPCTPTPLRPDDVIFSIYRLRPSTLRPDDVIIFDDVTMTSPT